MQTRRRRGFRLRIADFVALCARVNRMRQKGAEEGGGKDRQTGALPCCTKSPLLRGLPFSTYALRGRGVSKISPIFAYDKTDRLREMRTRGREGV